MKNNAKSKEFGDKELITMGDVRAALHALVSDVLSGRITMAESVSLRKGPQTLEASLALVKDQNHEVLKLIMK